MKKPIIEQNVIDSAWVLKSAVEVYEAAFSEGDYSTALRAVETAGKHVSVDAFARTVQHNHTVSVDNDIYERLTAARGQLSASEGVLEKQPAAFHRLEHSVILAEDAVFTEGEDCI